jgi:hypothetical protein
VSTSKRHDELVGPVAGVTDEVFFQWRAAYAAAAAKRVALHV